VTVFDEEDGLDYQAKIIELDPSSSQALIHFMRWSSA